MPMFTARSAGLSDTGRVRKNNEDSFVIDPPMYIVADGMGGAAAGEVASQLAVKIIAGGLSDLMYSSDDSVAEQALRVFKQADDEIKKQMKANPDLSGMGTTAVMAIQYGDRLFIGNIGDSRAYVISSSAAKKAAEDDPSAAASAETGIMKAFDDTEQAVSAESGIIRVTEDHSVVMDMVASGVIEEEDIRTHPLRNRITRCLGSIGNSDPEFYWYRISDGDTLILCSDGLWEMIHDDILLAVVNSTDDLEDLNQRLINAANNSGGVDNITVIAVRFTAE